MSYLQDSDLREAPSPSPAVRTSVKKTLVGAGIVTAALALLMPVPARATLGSVVTCGQTITTSIRLANDLHNCASDGLVVGADDVVIDLAGHTIDGVNSPGSEGISDVGYADLVVKNGTVRDFFLNGVTLRDAPGSSVRGLTIRQIGAGGGESDASAGVLVKDSPGSSVIDTIVKNDVESYQSDGVDVLSSASTLLSGNRLLSNSWNGAFVLNSPYTRVIGNQFDGNVNQGIEVNGDSDEALVSGNSATGNGSNGIVVGAVARVRVVSNSTSGNAESGLFFFGLIDSAVRGNRATQNYDGIVLAGGEFGSSGNRLSGNVVTGNDGTGLGLFDGADHNWVVSNVAEANQGDGIIVVVASGNTLTFNRASRNVGVGIGVFEDAPGDSPGNKLTGNTANRNGAHGIDVAPGTIDGGSNVAHLNTPLPNCIGVVCV